VFYCDQRLLYLTFCIIICFWTVVKADFSVFFVSAILLYFHFYFVLLLVNKSFIHTSYVMICMYSSHYVSQQYIVTIIRSRFGCLPLTGGSSIGLLPASMKERLSAALPTVQAHSSKFCFVFLLLKYHLQFFSSCSFCCWYNFK